MSLLTPTASIPRLLLGLDPDAGRLDLPGHLETHGSLPPAVRPRRGRPHPLLAEVEAAGLTGRGGAGFPLVRKLRAVLAAGGRGVVVVNAAESEPASRKDALLAARLPHLILDGAGLVAEITRAREVVVWLHRGSTAERTSVERAIHERHAAGYPVMRVRVAEGPNRYVAGQSSAVVRHLSGGPAKPTTSPPHATERGVGGRPTLVLNAETAAHLALLARQGAAWYRELGTPDAPGTVLVTAAGAVARPGVAELELGVPVAQALTAAGGAQPGFRGVLVGGYAGGWLSPAQVDSTPLTASGLRAAGSTLGVGLVAVLPSERCPVAETARLTRWLAGESAGQCGPCWNGLPALADALEELASTGGHHLRERLERWAGMVTRRGACHHPDGVALLVRSLLVAFGEHVDEHRQFGWCGAEPPGGWMPVPPTEEPGFGKWR